MGGNRYCDCNNPESCTGGLSVRTNDSTPQDEGTAQQNATQDNLATELSVAFLLLMVWLKLRA